MLTLIVAATSSSGPDRSQYPWSAQLPSIPSPFQDRDPLQRHASTQMSDSEQGELEKLLHMSKWKRIASHRQGGIVVYEQRMPGSQQVCLRAEGELDASAEAVLDVFRSDDIRLIQDYNPTYDEGCDLVSFDESGDDTKLSWAVSKGVYPVRPREFITRTRYLRTRTGEVAVLSEGLASHERAPQLRASSVRARIVTAVQLVTPVADGRCYFTSIAQVHQTPRAPPRFVQKSQRCKLAREPPHSPSFRSLQVEPGGNLPAVFTNNLARRDAPRALIRCVIVSPPVLGP